MFSHLRKSVQKEIHDANGEFLELEFVGEYSSKDLHSFALYLVSPITTPSFPWICPASSSLAYSSFKLTLWSSLALLTLRLNWMSPSSVTELSPSLLFLSISFVALNEGIPDVYIESLQCFFDNSDKLPNQLVGFIPNLVFSPSTPHFNQRGTKRWYESQRVKYFKVARLVPLNGKVWSPPLVIPFFPSLFE